MITEAYAGKSNVIGMGGTVLKSIPILVGVRPIIGRLRDPSTAKLSYRFASDIIYLPLQMVTPVGSIQDPHIQGIDCQPLQDRLHVYDTVVCQSKQKYNKMSLYGSVGIVESVDDDKALVRIHTIPTNMRAGLSLLQSLKAERWYTAEQLRSHLKLSVRAILGIAGYYPIFDDQSDKKWNIGLGLFDRDRMIPGR